MNFELRKENKEKLLNLVNKHFLELIKQCSYYDKETGRIILGNLIELNINHDKDCIDIYKYADLSKIDDDDDNNYDFDNDYLTTICINTIK